MAQTYFSKLDLEEKTGRLVQLGLSKVKITLWVKGQKDKYQFSVLEFDKERSELVLDSKDSQFPVNSSLLCSFELRGMSFFSQVTLVKSIMGHNVLVFQSDLYKSEKRSSYRLLTYPIYEVWAEFDLGISYEGGNVVNLKSKTSTTALFKNFLKLVDGKSAETPLTTIKLRVQDLSTTGMAIHIGDVETQFFKKNFIFKDVNIIFTDEMIVVPEVRIVYVVDYLSGDKNLKTYKVGLNFINPPTNVDEQLGKKINALLREINFNKDFENFLK